MREYNILNLLIFEYAMAMGLENPIITVEGQYMLEGLLSDLNSTGADFLISKYSKLNTTTESRNCNSIVIDEEVSSWLDENISEYDTCFPVAPEEDLILYGLTKMMEDNGVKIIGSSSDAVLICSDKFRTYEILKNDFPLVKSEKVYFSNLKNYKNIFNNRNKKMLVKPADGVSCSGVRVVQSYADFIKAAANIKRMTRLPFLLLQDYLEGRSTSVSILSTGKKALPMSLNLQDIKLNQDKLVYTGGKVPYEHRLSDEAKDISKKAVESISGLKGYVGVDLLLDEANDTVHILEINPRLTTSYVALRRLSNFNLGESIINAVNGSLPSEINIDGSVSFKKGNDIIFK